MIKDSGSPIPPNASASTTQRLPATEPGSRWVVAFLGALALLLAFVGLGLLYDQPLIPSLIGGAIGVVIVAIAVRYLLAGGPLPLPSIGPNSVIRRGVSALGQAVVSVLRESLRKQDQRDPDDSKSHDTGQGGAST